MREKEADINCLNSNGLPAPLGRIPRVYKWDTKNIIADDGFREMTTMNEEQHKNPKVHRVQEAPTLRMINKYNIAELSLVDRPVAGPKAGFGATIDHFGKNHDRRFFKTTNHDFHGKSHKDTNEEAQKNWKKEENKASGDPLIKEGSAKH